ncbi:putative SAM-dependent methyltransferase [Flavobacterium sp. W4I14]|nr:putative SAM-dependent methyltransferase [Flavobacterium sp. W4I14]
MLTKAVRISNRRKVVLMLGGNIGNMGKSEAIEFCCKLFEKLSPGDLVIMGFDLKKNPRKILDAYNDSKGVTAEFNLNLLSRINRELNADFSLENFEHYQTYDPVSGECKSYLVSLEKQQVKQNNNVYHFEKDEVIFMEVSRKFEVKEIEQLAQQSRFICTDFIFDSKEWFSDVVWKVTQS